MKNAFLAILDHIPSRIVQLSSNTCIMYFIKIMANLLFAVRWCVSQDVRHRKPCSASPKHHGYGAHWLEFIHFGESVICGSKLRGRYFTVDCLSS